MSVKQKLLFQYVFCLDINLADDDDETVSCPEKNDYNDEDIAGINSVPKTLLTLFTKLSLKCGVYVYLFGNLACVIQVFNGMQNGLINSPPL